ncbi:MAG TPA: alkaline phosphatase family protein [Solirubrobacteraceae bacterium]|nr:alkaline phosphatase family protein [Solirubrobacteraceae bacterium]
MGPTVLIGLDGATFDVLDPYMEAGVMPNLAALSARGTRAVLRSIMPPLTPPAWTSMVTGKHPGQHGIFDFFQKEEPGSVYFSFATSQEVRSATIWTLASEQERRIISLNFPLMFPPPPVEGAVVPGGMMPWRQLRLGCHPPGLFDRLKELPAFNPREMLDMELEIKAIDGCPEDEHAEFVELHIRREQRWAEVVRHLMGTEQADLVGVMFDGVDKLQHLCWRFIDPAFRPSQPSAWEQDMIDLCERYFHSLDGLIAGIVEQAGPEATIVLASDHGFGPTRDVFHVNSWLEQQGYLTWAGEDSPEDRGDTEVGFAEMTRHVHALDWSRTVAYAATPSSQGINIVERLPGGEQPMPEDVRAKLAQEIAGALREVRRPHDGEALVEEVWTREQAFSGPFEQLGPDLSLVLADGGTMSILPSETVVARRPEARGHHRWEGIFLATGPGIRKGASVEELSIVDVAPLLLHQLGLAAPEDMAGSVPEAVFEPGELERRPPRSAPAPAPPEAIQSPQQALELEPEEQAAVMERLRALGYVE